MDKQEFLKLLDKYLEGKVSDEEVEILNNYYNSFQQTEEWNEEELGSSEQIETRMLGRLKDAINVQETIPVVPIYKRKWFRIAAAAAVIFLLGSTVWWSIHHRMVRPIASAAGDKKNLQQFLNSGNAVLMLANGKLINLDSTPNGVLTQNQDVTIRKQDGLLVYERPGMSTGDAQPTLSYHTLFIPRGLHYQVVLPDGSKVWLNAASSLRFPSAFTTKQRKVELNGEAYFEVAKDAGKPFQVYVSALGSSQKGALVEVLGTHFNINAYDNEQVLRTTLLEGSVKITPVQASGITPDQSRLLLPGQQAQIFSNSETQQSVKVHTVDVETEVAWKNNLFNFHLADIKTIMRQMARWYDVEVVYEGVIPVRSFSGKINRNTNLNTVLKILEQSGIHFRVEGKRIIVRS